MNLDYPFHFGNDGRTARDGDDNHIRDMIEQVLFTSRGERVNRPDFGSSLMQMVFAPNSPEVATALQLSIQADVQRWLGDLIEVQSLQVTSVDSTLNIDIVYLVRATNEQQRAQFISAV